MNPIRLKRPGQPEPLNETAAAWVFKAEEGRMNKAEQDRLREWLEVPDHAQAFNDALWAVDALQRHSGSPELMAMRDAALRKRPDNPHRRYGLIAGFGSVTIAAAASVWLSSGPAWKPSMHEPVASERASPVAGRSSARTGLYRTGIGERSAVILPDGSLATLDTDSQLRIAYSATERGVYLVKGQALFEVAKHKPLPFQVYAAAQRITAVGTTFDVRIEGKKVQISMAEGVVKVRPLDGVPKRRPSLQEITLRAGERLTADPSAPAIVTKVDASQVATWRGGLLVFEDKKLSDAVAEINRYTDQPIKIADPSIGRYRVTGVFKTSDPDHFATAMSEVFPIQVRRDAAGSPVLQSLH